nr:MAG TPA: hypothetical protein [Caudoviricetes sp.]
MRYVEPSRRRPARAASVRRSGKQKAIKSFFNSVRRSARRRTCSIRKRWKINENKPSKHPRGTP